MAESSYTHYPRPILWLLRGGTLAMPGEEGGEVPPPRKLAPFYISKTPITNKQFQAFDPDHGRSSLSPEDDGPAVGISHAAAAGYCDWYARVSRKPMRLPTELEWEYACRGGTSGRYFFPEASTDADGYIWHAGNSGGVVRDPREKLANPFGLHGMLGTVWEWTTTSHHTARAKSTGEEVASSGLPCVLRGGSFRMEREQISCSLRRGEDPDMDLQDVGFRIVRYFS